MLLCVIIRRLYFVYNSWDLKQTYKKSGSIPIVRARIWFQLHTSCASLWSQTWCSLHTIGLCTWRETCRSYQRNFHLWCSVLERGDKKFTKFNWIWDQTWEKCILLFLLKQLVLEACRQMPWEKKVIMLHDSLPKSGTKVFPSLFVFFIS